MIDKKERTLISSQDRAFKDRFTARPEHLEKLFWGKFELFWDEFKLF